MEYIPWLFLMVGYLMEDLRFGPVGSPYDRMNTERIQLIPGQRMRVTEFAYCPPMHGP